MAVDDSPPPEALTPLWALKAIYFIGTGSGACLFKMMPVYFHKIGLANDQIGMIQAAKLAGDFFANLGWAALVDYLGHFKGVLCATHVSGTLLLCCLLLPAVQRSFALVVAVLVLGSGVLSSRGSVVDALTLQVVEDYGRAAGAQELAAVPGGAAAPVNIHVCICKYIYIYMYTHNKYIYIYMYIYV